MGKIEHNHCLSKLEGDLVLNGLDMLIPTLKTGSKRDAAEILAEHFRIGRGKPKLKFRLRTK